MRELLIKLSDINRMPEAEFSLRVLCVEATAEYRSAAPTQRTYQREIRPPPPHNQYAKTIVPSETIQPQSRLTLQTKYQSIVYGRHVDINLVLT
jgi:hypothetical protein